VRDELYSSGDALPPRPLGDWFSDQTSDEIDDEFVAAALLLAMRPEAGALPSTLRQRIQDAASKFVPREGA